MSELKQNLRQIAQVLVGLSGVATILAIIGALTQTDIWLAPTQWILVAILVAVFGIYTRLEA